MKDFEVIWLAKQMSTAFDRAEIPVLQELDLSPSEALLLISIDDLGRQYCYATELHLALGLSRPAVSSTLKRLREKEYIYYQEDDLDDRKKRILLCSKSLEVIPTLRQELSSWLSALTDGVSHADLDAARRVLKVLRSRL